jgi:hypothetical protein
VISEATGEISFEAPSFQIASRLQLDTFTTSPQFSGFERVIWNAGFSQFYIKSAYIGQHQFAVRLMFFNQQLKEVGLHIIMQSDVGGWSNWSEEHEQKRYDIHKSIILELFPRHQLSSSSGGILFSWGHIYPLIDCREHYTEILVKYAAS